MQKYIKVPKSTNKYPKVPQGSQKYLKVSKSTSKYPKVPQSTQNPSDLFLSVSVKLILKYSDN